MAANLICKVLGAAAGGGFPQWNCGCRLCQLARSGDPDAVPRTQVSVAVSADGERWLIIGASPDLRQQITDTPALHPVSGARDTPIVGVALVSADVDGLAGLLVLREQQALPVYAPAAILDVLAANSVFGVLDPSLVRRVAVPPGTPIDVGHGMTLTLLPMPGKIPLYQENRAAALAEAAPTFAAKIDAGGRSVIIAPGCAEITDAVQATLAGADLLFFDATVFTDDEMITAGMGRKTGRRMGHVPISGPDGSMARLADLPGRRIYLHINNTNPILLARSPERRAVEAAGFEVAYDGMEIAI